MCQSISQFASQTSQFSQKHSIFIDTDIGDDIDDALALALALHSPELDIKGISTVFGDTQKRAHLAMHLLNSYGRNDIPVAAGIGMPLLLRHRPSGVPQAAILDKREKFQQLSALSGPDLLIKTALEHRKELTVLCLGPLTNIAAGLAREPQLFMVIRNLIVMGGTSGIPFPEWNIRSDAKAAQIVLGSGIPVTLLGWNVTTQCQMQERDLACFQANTKPQVQLLYKLLRVWQRHRPAWHPALPYLHDPLAVLALYAPELFRFENMTAHIETRNPFRGYMVPRILDGPLVHAAVDVQAEKARALIMQRLVASL